MPWALYGAQKKPPSSTQTKITLKSPTTLYIPIDGVWPPAGGYKVSEDCQAFEAFKAK